MLSGARMPAGNKVRAACRGGQEAGWWWEGGVGCDSAVSILRADAAELGTGRGLVRRQTVHARIACVGAAWRHDRNRRAVGWRQIGCQSGVSQAVCVCAPRICHGTGHDGTAY